MIRDAGLIPGLSAHMPEMITYTDENGYDIETYIQIFNCAGFLMQVEIEDGRLDHPEREKAGHEYQIDGGGPRHAVCRSYVQLERAAPCDMVTVGAFSADEVHEDVEISLAALEHRFRTSRSARARS